MMILHENERLDEVNDKLRLIQRTTGLTFGTDALLLAGYMEGRLGRGMELGSGTGIISMLALTRGKLSSVTAVELQPIYAELTERNAALNGLSDKLSVLCTDVRELKGDGTYDTVFTNPPYMRTDSGRANDSGEKNIARHEVAGDISDFVRAAKGVLRFGGYFYAVYRPDRLTDLIAAMRAEAIEPKRMTFVHSDTEHEPSVVLVEGRAGGKGGMRITPPLIIYLSVAERIYTADMDYIMENGRFPEKYRGK